MLFQEMEFLQKMEHLIAQANLRNDLKKRVDKVALHNSYRVTILDGYNLLLTYFRQSWQLLGHYCSCLQPKWVDGTFQILVNGRL